ncbi:MAG: sulfatase-like hydrolase/transferase [Bacteroidales bacterium]|nr:sulfatase-like hydrolase/transferase [Bacteroidales bacterium]
MSETKKSIIDNINTLNTNITQRVKTNVPLQLRYVFGVYFLCIFFMIIFRLTVFFVHCFTTLSDLNFLMLIRSLLQGIRFDTIVVCGLLAPFVVLFSLLSMINFNRKWIYRPLHLLLTFACFVLFLLYTVDSAYFTYFHSHINIIVLSWLKTPKYLFEVLLHSPVYLFYVLVFLGSLAWFFWLMFCLYNATLFKTIPPYNVRQPLAKTIIVSLLTFLLCFVGLRGRIYSEEPVSISTAYFSDNDFFNQLGVSPMFSLVKSFQEERELKRKNIPYIDPIKGRQIVEQEFANRDDFTEIMPELKENCNVVFVIMEDVLAEQVTRSKMPNLSTISKKSLNFTNVYADGNYVYNGIYSILFAYPNVFSNNSMISTVVPKMDGLPTLFKQHGYKTFFFTSKAQKADNTTRFLHGNDVDVIFSGKANDLKKEAKALDNVVDPFFVCLLVGKEESKNYLRQTDNKINQIIMESKRYSWFKNTLFVFVGANGYNQKVPLYFYAPSMLKGEVNNTIACQTDILPTLMTMLDKNYRNESMGLNIYSKRRSYAFSSKEDEMTVRNDTLLYTWNKNKKEVYNNVDRATEMKHYVLSMFQAAEYNVAQKKMKRE